jgi:hypothetical protein
VVDLLNHFRPKLNNFVAELTTEPLGGTAMTTRDPELTERRELAHRINEGIDVTLFWSKASNRVMISVLHARSSTALEFEVDGADALDAFNHPFVYAMPHSSTTPQPTHTSATADQ